MRNVYLYHPSTATYLGNGGMVWASQATTLLSNLGYNTYVFDCGEQNRYLQLDDFEWLDNNKIKIAALEQVLDDPDAVVIGTWLRTLIPIFEQHPQLKDHFIFRDAGHLLRAEMIAEREYARQHRLRVAIMNPGLDIYYRLLDIQPQWRWQYWVEEFFQPRVNDVCRVGVQLEDNNPSVYTVLVDRLGKDCVVQCNGSRREVADKMASCRIFLSWNNPAMLLPGDGESFGRSLSEAMACSCVLVSWRNLGVMHYTYEGRRVFMDSVIYYDRLAYAVDCVEKLMNDLAMCRSNAYTVIAQSKAFRLSDAHVRPIITAVDNV